MNLPGRPAGNWRWRFRRDMLKPELASRLKKLVRAYDR
jgi:4-alpha-glucanotransferase